MLAALLLPSLVRAKSMAHQATCLSNLRQLGFAWTMYKDDNLDRLAQSYPETNPFAWVQGNMTNASQAVDPNLIQAGVLYPYDKDAQIYHCPTDPGVMIGGSRVQSVRSYSMNSYMGDRPSDAPPNVNSGMGYMPLFARGGDLPDPSKLFILIDEDERSISTGSFQVDPTARVWFSFPAVSSWRHSYSSTMVFGDGHGWVWVFRDPRTTQVNISGTDQLNNVDLATLAKATTVRNTAITDASGL
jgi:hypothetical protein